MFTHAFFSSTYFSPAYFPFGAPVAWIADRPMYYTRDVARYGHRVAAVEDALMPSRGQRARAVEPALTAVMPSRRGGRGPFGATTVVLGRRYGQDTYGSGTYGANF